MKYVSDYTGEEYKSEQECAKAEKAYLEEQKKKEAEKKELAEQRKARAKEVEDAMKAVQEAEKKYRELLNEFIKDYHSYHYTSTSIDEVPFRFGIFKDLFDFFNF